MIVYPHSFIKSGSFWVAGAFGTNRLGYSYDGKTWFNSNNGNSIFNAGVLGLAYGNNILIGSGGANNFVGYSYDGINWSASTQFNSIFTGAAPPAQVTVPGQVIVFPPPELCLITRI